MSSGKRCHWCFEKSIVACDGCEAICCGKHFYKLEKKGLCTRCLKEAIPNRLWYEQCYREALELAVVVFTALVTYNIFIAGRMVDVLFELNASNFLTELPPKMEFQPYVGDSILFTLGGVILAMFACYPLLFEGNYFYPKYFGYFWTLRRSA